MTSKSIPLAFSIVNSVSGVAGGSSNRLEATFKVYGYSCTIEEARALIAAAPELADELRETEKDLAEWDGTQEALDIIRANIRAALAKIDA